MSDEIAFPLRIAIALFAPGVAGLLVILGMVFVMVWLAALLAAAITGRASTFDNILRLIG